MTVVQHIVQVHTVIRLNVMYIGLDVKQGSAKVIWVRLPPVTMELLFHTWDLFHDYHIWVLQCPIWYNK